jgi:hypothetical protein
VVKAGPADAGDDREVPRRVPRAVQPGAVSQAELRHVVVAGNVGTAVAPRGVAQGAGIWNGVLLSGPPVQLFLADSAITRNRLTAHRGIVRRGAGLYATSPVTFRRTTIHGNRPDDCFGCG